MNINKERSSILEDKAYEAFTALRQLSIELKDYHECDPESGIVASIFTWLGEINKIGGAASQAQRDEAIEKGIVSREICPECQAEIPADGNCFFCENMPEGTK